MKTKSLNLHSRDTRLLSVVFLLITTIIVLTGTIKAQNVIFYKDFEMLPLEGVYIETAFDCVQEDQAYAVCNEISDWYCRLV